MKGDNRGVHGRNRFRHQPRLRTKWPVSPNRTLYDALLRELADGPLTTTELRVRVNDQLGTSPPLVAGQVYRALLTLQRRSMVRRVRLTSGVVHWSLTGAPHADRFARSSACQPQLSHPHRHAEAHVSPAAPSDRNATSAVKPPDATGASQT